jgi:hypothetical protein
MDRPTPSTSYHSFRPLRPRALKGARNRPDSRPARRSIPACTLSPPPGVSRTRPSCNHRAADLAGRPRRACRGRFHFLWLAGFTSAANQAGSEKRFTSDSGTVGLPGRRRGTRFLTGNPLAFSPRATKPGQGSLPIGTVTENLSGCMDAPATVSARPPPSGACLDGGD